MIVIVVIASSMMLFTIIAVLVMIPMMVMLDPAPLTIPIPGVIPLSVMMRHNPSRHRIGRKRPIAGMPFIMMPNGIPIALNPNEFRGRPWRKDMHNMGRGRRTNGDTD